MAQDYDLIVIGSGPGGYVSAIRAAQLGLRTAIIERDALGGICLNWGCIPTKALLRSAEVLHLARDAVAYGLKPLAPEADLEAMVKRSRDVAGQLSKGVQYLMKKHQIEVIRGTARLEPGTPAPQVIVTEGNGGERRLSSSNVLLATGARARTLPDAGLEPDGDRIWTYREAMVPTELPERLVVIGSGAIGIEFASFYRTLGADVTVVEAVDRILPAEDEEIAGLARKAFEKAGIRFIVGASVKALEATEEGVTTQVQTAEGTQTLQADRAILAIGIVGNVEGLGLDALGVEVARGHVKVDAFGWTGVEGLYAIGDVTGPPWLAHKASHEGVACVEAMVGLETAHPFDADQVPGCTYSHPQIASIGLTEADAREAGREIRVGRFPFMGNGKAIALGAPEGLVKTIFDATTGELLGAHMVGAEVTELIQGFAIARQGELTEAELMQTVFPHPTLSEMMHESVLDAYGRVLHI